MCLAKTAASYPAFLAAKSWVVHVVGFQHTDLARRFATTGIDKFAAGGFARNVNGDPVFGGASAVLECAAFAQHDGGDHTILIGEVTDAYGADPLPAIYFRRGYHTVAPDQYR
jgi:flavin reductase ActVB